MAETGGDHILDEQAERQEHRHRQHEHNLTALSREVQALRGAVRDLARIVKANDERHAEDIASLRDELSRLTGTSLEARRELCALKLDALWHRMQHNLQVVARVDLQQPLLVQRFKADLEASLLWSGEALRTASDPERVLDEFLRECRLLLKENHLDAARLMGS